MVPPISDQVQPPGKSIVRTRRFRISLVWIVPIVAVLIGISLVVHSIMQKGPTITVTFNTGSGLTANKTQVKYRNVVIGQVSDVALSKNQRNVDVTIDLAKEAESFTREDSQFWVVSPRIGASGVSGIDTLLSGDYIGADIGHADVRANRFDGLESPPPITYGEPGKRFTLHSEDLGSLDIGSSVYFRKIPVGQVVAYALDPDGEGVSIDIFVHAPNDAYVTEDTRFWNASGIDIDMGADGVSVQTESLSSLLLGGVVFSSPRTSVNDQPAAENSPFALFDDRQTALAPPNGKPQYLSLRFEQGLRGLKMNAPVEFSGIDIGKVVSVNLDFNPIERSFPLDVGIVIYPQRLGQAHAKMLKALNHDPNDEAAGARLMGTFIDNGLRAQARTGNLLTGQLYISLDFYPEADSVEFDPTIRPVNIPTIPGSIQQVQEHLQALVDNISKLPLDRIAENLDRDLIEMREVLAQFNAHTLPGVQTTLTEADRTLKSVNSMLAEDSPQQEQLTQTLEALSRMSRSLRELLESLGRHPESLIRGRPGSSAPLPAQDK